MRKICVDDNGVPIIELDKGKMRKICFTPQGVTVDSLECLEHIDITDFYTPNCEAKQKALDREAYSDFMMQHGIRLKPHSTLVEIVDKDKWKKYMDANFPTEPQSEEQYPRHKHWPFWDRSKPY